MMNGNPTPHTVRDAMKLKELQELIAQIDISKSDVVVFREGENGDGEVSGILLGHTSLIDAMANGYNDTIVIEEDEDSTNQEKLLH